MKNKSKIPAMVCLLAMVLNDMAAAKVLIIDQRLQNMNADNLRNGRVQAIRNVRIINEIIRLTGGESKVRQTHRLKTEWVRTGTIGYAYNTTTGLSGSTERFDAVIGTTWASTGTGSIVTGQVRVDSLTLWEVQNRSGTAVPFLALIDNQNQVIGGSGQWYVNQFCSTGASSCAGGKGINVSHGVVSFPGSTSGYWPHAYVESAFDTFDTGDVRVILTASPFQYWGRRSFSDDGNSIGCKWCDSLATTAGTDSLILWERQYFANSRKIPTSGASTIVFASAWGGGSAIDSLGNVILPVNTPATEGDFPLILMGLARLDSIVRATSTTGGKVLGDKVIKIAPVVYGGLARGERHAWKSPGAAQGIFNSDTSAFYAILDSIAALDIPITFAVNVDSASSYARDVIKMKQIRKAKFTPQIWNGVSDTSKAGGQDALYRPVDVFGRYRDRFAIGDDTGVGADSSIKTLASSALRMTDSLFGKGKVSRMAVAPDDDWSPYNVTGALKRSTWNIGIDSVMYALKAAGYIGLIADGQDPDARITNRKGVIAKNNPRGYYWRQQTYNSANIPALKRFKILTHSGYSIMGGRAQYISYADSSQSAVAYTGLFYKEASRFWSGALLSFDNGYDTWPHDGGFDGDAVRAYDNIQQRKVDRTQAAGQWTSMPAVRGSVYRLSCADLSGVPYGGPGGAPAANSYWILKSAKNAMEIINRLAGRTIVEFAYPEDIEP